MVDHIKSGSHEHREQRSPSFCRVNNRSKFMWSSDLLKVLGESRNVFAWLRSCMYALPH